MINKFNAWVSKIAGPNTAHVLDGIVAFELTAAGAAIGSDSARAYATHHPVLVAVFAFAPPVLTAAASKFRKAATNKPPADTPKA